MVSTEEMLAACLDAFPRCDGLIAVAAPCDYRPRQVARQKIKKTGAHLALDLVETLDIVATLATIKQSRWMVAFALETEDQRLRAMQKLERKSCDLVVVNGPAAIHAEDTRVEVLDAAGQVLAALSGPKSAVAEGIFRVIQERLVGEGRTKRFSA